MLTRSIAATPVPTPREGGTRTLVVPPKLGYGKKGSGADIPPDSTLRFVITLRRLQLEG